jgi:hypothetical protein
VVAAAVVEPVTAGQEGKVRLEAGKLVEVTEVLEPVTEVPLGKTVEREEAGEAVGLMVQVT